MMSTARRGMVYSHSVEAFPQRTNSHSPRNQRYSSGSNGQRPSKDGGRTGSPQDRRLPSSPQGRSPRRSKTDLLHQGILQTSDIHQSLYDDAFARSQRLEMMRHQREEEQEQQLKEELELKEERMKGWGRLYHYRDHRTHLEREEDTLRRKHEKIARLEAEKLAKEAESYKECTFQPSLKKSLNTLHPGRTKSPAPIQSSSSREVALPVDPEERLRRLVERQHGATVQLQGLAQDEERLRQHLHTVHSELHERIQREETQRVVLMLQDADAEGSTQRDLIQRVRHMVQSGDDPEVAQRQIVEELVTRSQDEVRRRVQEAYGPIRLELEGDLYQRRLALVHELESLEAQSIALRGGTLVEDARQMGFEFGLAEKCRRSLSFMTPGSTQRVPTPPIIEEAVVSAGLPMTARQRISSFGADLSLPQSQVGYASLAYPRDGGKAAGAQCVGRNLTPRSSHTPQALSRQSSRDASSEAAIVHTAAMMVQQDVPVEVCEREEMSADGRSPRERAAAAAAVAAALATSSSTSSMPGALPSASELKDSHYSCLTSTHMTLTSPVRDEYATTNGMQASGSGQGSTPQSPLSPRQGAAVAATSKATGGVAAETPPIPSRPMASFSVPGGVVQEQATSRSVASSLGAPAIFQVQTIGALPMTPPMPAPRPPTVVPAATMDAIRVRSGTTTPTYTGALGTNSMESMRLYSGSQTPSVATPGAVTPPAPAIVSARTLPSRNAAAQMFMQAQSLATSTQEEVGLSSDKSPAVLSHRTVAPAPAQVMTQQSSCSNRVVAMSCATPPTLGMSTSMGNLRTIPATMPMPTVVSAGQQVVAPSRSVAAPTQVRQAMPCSAGQYSTTVVDSYPHLTPIQRGRVV